ncbi:MAG: hypothetical protein HY321_03730 [Armatimonadetes bacterium]|nr:hypothetical protein [Armatimonadota bacterium]
MHTPRSRLLTAVLVCFLSVVAGRADAHTHHWYAYSAPDFYGPTIPTEYIWVSTDSQPQYLWLFCGMYQDIDLCSLDGQGEDPDCPAPFCGFGWNEIKVAWDDDNAGGTFGRLEGDTFTPVGPSVTPAQVNAYEVPTSPGVVQIRAQVDEDPQDPQLGPPTIENPSVYSANDSPVWSAPVPVTVWEFTISDGAANWVPALDDTREFTAKILPVVDQYGLTMARPIDFHISSSAEGGYCLNANRLRQKPDDTLGDDLKFLPKDLEASPPLPGQPEYVTILREDWAQANGQCEAMVRVTCLDYGAYGSISAETEILGEPAATARVVGKLTRYAAQMPIDELPAAQGEQPEGNHIADSSP